ncbi:MAG: ParB/RepB/Spo0J family partition protein [Bacilli bacterium]|jgi:ParB family chromosome partitioning protein|nr:ParB/RepB/Spo0J family partition protein [Bacilli bacterium]
MNKMVESVRVVDIRINPNQPRKYFNEQSIKELAQSIKENGLIQPIILRALDNYYELVAGERRLRAIKYLNYDRIDAIIQDVDVMRSNRMAIIENIQREDLSSIEEASAYIQLLEDYQMTQQELADTLGKSQSTIANKIRLLGLDPKIQESILDKNLTERHGRALLKISDLKVRKNVYQKILADKMNVQTTEKYINELIQQNKPVHKKIISKVDYRLEINTIKKAISLVEQTGVLVKTNIVNEDDGVKIVIELKK